MPNCKVTAESLSEWFTTPQGGYVLAREQAYFDRTVSDIFGYNALQLGLPEHDFVHSSRIPLRFCGADQAGAQVRLCDDELPFACDSLDPVSYTHLRAHETRHDLVCRLLLEKKKKKKKYSNY